MHFSDFLKKIENNTFDTTVNARGIATIQQTIRNKLRAEGQEALFEDLQDIFTDFDCLMTKDGIVFVSHNKDFEFSFQIKCTVPSIDYDPYFEADDYAEQEQLKAEKKKQKEADAKAKAERQAKLRAEYKKNQEK